MAEFQSQLESLSRTARRLQTANARIENDFEASMLASYAPASFVPERPQNGGQLHETQENGAFDSLEFDRYTEFHESSRDLSDAIQECYALSTSMEGLKGMLEASIEDQRRDEKRRKR